MHDSRYFYCPYIELEISESIEYTYINNSPFSLVTAREIRYFDTFDEAIDYMPNVNDEIHVYNAIGILMSWRSANASIRN